MAAEHTKPAFYSTEDGEWFWVKADCTAEEARALIERDLGVVIPAAQVSLVHGFEHRKHGEPRFVKTSKGAEFWELVND